MLLLLAIGVSGLGTHLANQWIESRSTAVESAGDVGPLPDGRVLRVFSLGFERLVADLFWLRTVYYVGDDASTRAGYPAASRLATLVTDIDPEFHTAYVLMNSVLTVLRPEPEAAVALLDKGIAHLPGSWRLHFLQGFNHFAYREDYERAARYMHAAAERGGPTYLPLLATRLYSAAGEPDTAIAFIAARLEQEESEAVREALESRLRDLVIVRDLRRIDAAIEAWAARYPAPPPNVAALVGAGLLPVEPRDPDGNPYEIRDGRAASRIEHDPLDLHRIGGEA